MARTFSQAAGDFLRFPVVAANNITAPVTIVAILKRTAVGNLLPVLMAHTSGGAIAGPSLLLLATGKAEFTTDGNVANSDSTFTITSAEGYVFVAVSKASGTVLPRFHKYVYGTNVWTHQNGSASLANGSAPGTTGTWRIGEWNAQSNYDGDIAVAGLFPRVLGDQDVEALAYSLAAWLSNAPVGLWPLDQAAVAHKVVDFAGNSNESARGGTAVGSGSVPVWNYSDGVWLPTHPASGPGAQSILAGDIASAEAFGADSLNVQALVQALVSAGAGVPNPSLGVQAVVPGVPTAEAVGSPSVGAQLVASAIASGELFGVPILGVSLLPPSFNGLGSFVSPVSLGVGLVVPGVGSAEALGQALLNVGVRVVGVGSAEAFGLPGVSEAAARAPSGVVFVALPSLRAGGGLAGLRCSVSAPVLRGEAAAPTLVVNRSLPTLEVGDAL